MNVLWLFGEEHLIINLNPILQLVELEKEIGVLLSRKADVNGRLDIRVIIFVRFINFLILIGTFKRKQRLPRQQLLAG